MFKSLTSIISLISLLVLSAIQVYVINKYYSVKSKNFDMIYSTAVISTIEQNEYDYLNDSIENALDKLAFSILSANIGDLANVQNKLSRIEVLAKFDSILSGIDANSKTVKLYTIENNLDTSFKAHYIINEIELLAFNKKLVVYKNKPALKNANETEKEKGLYIKSYYKEGNYYAIQYDYYIDFTQKRKIILKEMAGLMLLVILTLAMIMAAFANTLYSLRRQKKISELKSDFIDNITHEFKTPISIISVGISTLKHNSNQNDMQKRTEIYKVLEKQNMLLSKMIDNVIDVSLIDRNRIDLDLKSVVLKPYLHGIINSYFNEVSGKNIQISEEYLVPDSFEYTLDPIQFARVLYNLFNNSLKYNEHEPVIQVHVRIESQLIIEIIDNGIGIKEKELEEVFGRFYRGGNTNNVKGLGLGLYLVRKIIEKHKGTIHLTSVSGVGTTVIISLPV